MSILLMDASGAFGNWGQASGFTTAQAQSMHARRQEFAREKIEEVIVEFEMPSNEKGYFSELKEQQLKTRDHTYVAPRTLFKTDFR